MLSSMAGRTGSQPGPSPTLVRPCRPWPWWLGDWLEVGFWPFTEGLLLLWRSWLPVRPSATTRVGMRPQPSSLLSVLDTALKLSDPDCFAACTPS